MATETAATGRDSDKFMLRLPDGMRERIKRSAEASGRTMNAEVVARLQRSFEAEQEEQEGSGTARLKLVAVGGDGQWTEKILKEIATGAAEEALHKVFQAQGIASTVKLGTPGLVQGPPPEPNEPSKK